MAEQTSSPYSMESADADEPIVATIRKHLIGLIALYVQSAVGLLAAAGLIYFLLPELVGTNNSRVYQIVSLFMVTATVLVVLFLLAATAVYRESRLIVTTKNLTQVIQSGLVSRKVSQLSLNDVQDVTADQQGLLATLFGYGTLKIETAGEQINFVFTYCPRPNYYAEQIREARENLDNNAA